MQNIEPDDFVSAPRPFQILPQFQSTTVQLLAIENCSHCAEKLQNARAIVVAEDRSGLYHRLDSSGLIDFGNWQIALRNALSEYLRVATPSTNSQMEPVNDGMEAAPASVGGEGIEHAGDAIDLPLS